MTTRSKLYTFGPLITLWLSVAIWLVFIGGAAFTMAQTTTAPGVEATSPDAPPTKAIMLKLQETVFDLQYENSQLTAEISKLRRQLLEVAKERATPEILKDWHAKPGETINWDRLQKVPAPVKDDKPASKATPVEPKQP